MTGYQTIDYAAAANTAVITLNRPQKLNAFTLRMGAEIIDAVAAAEADDRVRAIIFTGAGRGFCAGADISDGVAAFRPQGGDANFQSPRDLDFGGTLTRRLLDCSKPVIAAINGPAVGIGATFTLGMDFRLASTGARFGFAFTRRGLAPEACSSWLLPRVVGMSTAADWAFSGRIFDSAEALRAGLLYGVYEDDELVPAALELAHALTSASSPVAVAVTRRMLWRMFESGTAEAAHELDSRAMRVLGSGPDCAEGVDAFLHKRQPDFPLRVSTDLSYYMERIVPD